MIVLDVLIRAALDVVAAFVLTYVLYYRRYKSRELFVSAMMLNVAVFCVMGIIAQGDIGLQVGFGLFAVLSIFRFRSESFTTMEMAYIFCAIGIAAVNGIASFGAILVASNVLIVAAAAILDNGWVMRRTQETVLTLESIPPHLFDDEKTRKELGKLYGFEVVRFVIEKIDYVKETVTIKIEYVARAPKAAPRQTAKEMEM